MEVLESVLERVFEEIVLCYLGAFVEEEVYYLRVFVGFAGDYESCFTLMVGFVRVGA